MPSRSLTTADLTAARVAYEQGDALSWLAVEAACGVGRANETEQDAPTNAA
jgi:hypothetical protein